MADEYDFDLHARSLHYGPGEHFVQTVALPGYTDASHWGFDAVTGLYWADLWHNSDNHSGPPRISVSLAEAATHSGVVAVRLCTELNLDPVTVARGLGLSLPSRELPYDLIEGMADRLSRDGQPEEMRRGWDWVLGRGEKCPISGWPCYPGFLPEVEHIAAEVLYGNGLAQRRDLAPATMTGEELLYAVQALAWILNFEDHVRDALPNAELNRGV